MLAPGFSIAGSYMIVKTTDTTTSMTIVISTVGNWKKRCRERCHI
jgi:hypothetical protein